LGRGCDVYPDIRLERGSVNHKAWITQKDVM